MAGSDDSISSAASSGSDGEHSSRPAPVCASSSSRSTRAKSKSKKTSTTTTRREVVTSSTITHRHRHKLSHRFEFVRTLGCGTYGKVKLAVQLDTREEVAIKCIPKSKIDNAADLRRLRQEIEVMSSLHHPHIIKVIEVFESRDKIVMVMEHAAGGELYDFINDGNLTTSEAKRMFRQIVTAVHYLHKNNIVHRDLKLENVLLEKDLTVKIADFGLSSTFGHSLLDTFCGSPLYASPEIINGTPYHGPEVDCWSLGVVLYAMVYNTMPFHGADFTQLKKQIVTGDFYEPAAVSDASGLIHRMLTVDARKRITIEEILSHHWLRDGTRPAKNVSETCCHQHQGIPDRVRQGAGDSGLSSGDSSVANSSQETVRKPLAGILKKTLRRSSNKLGMSDSSLTSSSGKESGKTVDIGDDLAGEPDTEKGQKEVKAKRGILKKQGKDSGGDSGLEINESGQNKSGASLDSNERDRTKEKSKRDSGIDQDLTACCLVNENRKQEMCRLREPNQLKYVCKITRRHSRGKYSRVAKMWESIYATSFTKNSSNNAPPKASKEEEADPLERNSSSSSNEDILGILDSPSLRTPTAANAFQFTVQEVESQKALQHPTSEQEEEESYTKDELMGAMDAELLEVYQKALKISQAIM